MAPFIRLVHRDFNAPEVPFVIGALVTGGPADAMAPCHKGLYWNFRAAQAARAPVREYWRNVHAVLAERLRDADLAKIRNKRERTAG